MILAKIIVHFEKNVNFSVNSFKSHKIFLILVQLAMFCEIFQKKKSNKDRLT